MSAQATNPVNVPGQGNSNFVQMTDEEAIYQEEVAMMEKRGRRLRRAALTAGIMLCVSIVCTIYTTVSVRWMLIEWSLPEKTAYDVSVNLGLFKIGILCDAVAAVVETFAGVLIGLILIGAGVNAATSGLIIVFRVIQSGIVAFSVVFMVAATLMVDENLAIYSTVQQYFYSDNMPPIGDQIFFLMLLINKYGYIISQVFGGVHLGLLGFVVAMWGVMPRFLGYILSVAGPALVANAALHCCWPGYDGQITFLLMIPVVVSELWLAGWLLVNTPHPSKNRDLGFNAWREEGDEPQAQPAAATAAATQK